jgi:hypothetical protein
MADGRYLQTEGSGEGLRKEVVPYVWRRKMLNTYSIVRKIRSGGRHIFM